MQNTASAIGSGTLGAESFLGTLANLVGQAGQTVLAYQQQKYTERAQEKYGAPAEFTLLTPSGQEQVDQTPESFDVVTTAKQETTRAGGGINPLWLVAGGLGLLLLLRR